MDVAQLRSWFPSDQACLGYLDWLRWPDGFICPHCQSDSAGWEAAGRYRRRGCGRQISVTWGTLFHRTRTPLSVWFEVAWLMTAAKSGVSASYIHQVLPVSSYQTAWTMLAKFRQVMSTTHSSPLSGRVEVDEASFFGGRKSGSFGRGALGKVMVAGAVEITDHHGHRGWGRARLATIPDATARSLGRFVRGNIADGATVVTDAWRTYPSALKGPENYVHERINVTASGRPAHESLLAVHRLFLLVKRMIEGTYQGSGSAGHLQEYLDEFVFRFNRRHAAHRGLVFMRLLQRAVAAPPTVYRDLVRESRAKVTWPGVLPVPGPDPAHWMWPVGSIRGADQTSGLRWIPLSSVSPWVSVCCSTPSSSA